MKRAAALPADQRSDDLPMFGKYVVGGGRQGREGETFFARTGEGGATSGHVAHIGVGGARV